MKRRSFIKLVSGAVLTLNSPLISAFTGSTRDWSRYNTSIIIDGLSAAFDYGVDNLDKDSLAIFKRSGITALNATIPSPGDDFATTEKKIAATKHVINKYPDHFKLIESANDILIAKKHDKMGIIVGFQSTEMFGDNTDNITHFAQQGARIMQLSYNRRSQFGDGGLEVENRGLTKLGREAVEMIEQNKVLLDLSHSGQKTVAEAIKLSKRPLTISHTGCNSVYRHPRNNGDAELKAVAERGGVIGIYLMPFLEGGDGEITPEMLMRHIDHAINICGEDHVSIGSDQGVIPVADGPEYREFIRKEVGRRIAAGISAPGETPNRPPFIPQLNSERRMEMIGYHMKKRGHSDATIEKVLGKNLLKLFKEVW